MQGLHIPPDKRQLSLFEKLWKQSVEKLDHESFTVSASQELRWTILFQVPTQVWCSSSVVETLLRKHCAEQYSYDLNQLHMTVLGLGAAESWCTLSEPLKGCLEIIASEQNSIELRISGLNILNDSIVAQVIDATGSLAKLTADLTQCCRQLEGVADFAAGLHEELWWITLARLRAPISDDALCFISSHRNTEFGTVTMNEVSLLETNRNFELAQTRIIHRCFFGSQITKCIGNGT
jgi:hypothetical protein